MLSPATLDALHRLIAILLALIDALSAPVDGAPRPLAMRLATRAFSAYLKRLTAHLTETADQVTTAPASPPRPARSRHIPIRPTPPRIIPFTSSPKQNPTHIKIDRITPQPCHVLFVTISKLKHLGPSSPQST